MQLYSRHEDGWKLVDVTEVQGQKLYTVDGTVFTSARQLVKGLSGKEMSFDRYFRRGLYTPLDRNREFLIWDAVGPQGWAIPEAARLSTAAGSVRVKSGLGIDLAKRGNEVAKLMYHGFSRQIFSAGYDPQDVLQEVYKGILIRNAGSCPFDPVKASFGHYVHMVISCVLSNYHRKQQRTRRVEQSGVLSYQNGRSTIVDVSDAKQLSDISDTVDCSELCLSDDLSEAVGVSGRVLPLILAGWGQLEIADELGVSKAVVSRVVARLKNECRDWRN